MSSFHLASSCCRLRASMENARTCSFTRRQCFRWREPSNQRLERQLAIFTFLSGLYSGAS